MADEAVHGRSPVQPHAEDPAKPGDTGLGDRAARSSALAGPLVPGLLVDRAEGPPAGAPTRLPVMPFREVPGAGPEESCGPTRVVAASLAGRRAWWRRAASTSRPSVRAATSAPTSRGPVLSRATPPSTYRARAAPVDRAMDPLDVCRTFRTDGHAAALPVSPRVQVTGIMRTPSQARVTLTGGEATGRLAGIRVPLTKVIR